MSCTSANRHYWGEVINVLACISAYKSVSQNNYEQEVYQFADEELDYEPGYDAELDLFVEDDAVCNFDYDYRFDFSDERSADKDKTKSYIRYKCFKNTVATARIAYAHCYEPGIRHPHFGMSTEDEIDEFFSIMIMDDEHLEDCLLIAVSNLVLEAPAVPLRLFCG